MTAAKQVRVECQCCGHVLTLPPDLPERAQFTCGHCSLVMRNVEFTRAFRWAHLDPYVRKHGVSRANLWGGLAGSLVWVPALAGVMLWRGAFDLVLLFAVAAPYLVLITVMRPLRARTPAVLWGFYLWAGLGAFLLYLRVLLSFFLQRARVLLDASVPSISTGMLLAMGVSWLAIGVIGALLYRRRARRLPVLLGGPPRV